MPERQRTSAALLNAYAVLATVTGQTGSARRVLEATADTWLVDGTYVFPRALLVGELEQIDGHADVARRQFEVAAKEIKARLDAAPTDLWPIRAELWAQIGLGHQEEARAVLRTNLEKRPRPYRWTMGFTWWTGALRGCLLLGERAQALGLLKEACAEAPGRLLLRNLFRVDPKMAPFRDDPEVVALLAEPAPADSSGKLVPPDKKSVAVLPFVNMGADKNDEYLGDGMTEELLNALAKVKGLRVPGRSSSFAFKGRNDDDIFRQVSAKLHVSTVLEGSVRKVGDKLRITAQLINCADGNHLWSEEYDRSMADLLAVQAEVAQQVAQKLQVALGVDETRALAKAATRNPEAHRLYLLGRFHFAKLTEAGYAEAARYYHEALRLDPDYALPYCGLADNYGFFGGVSMPGREAWPKQKELAEKALALDPNLAEAHFSLGLAFADTFDWPAAEREMRRALELNPNYALAHDQYAWVLLTQGRIDEALAEQARALEIDPLSPLYNLDYAMWLTYARRWDEAYAQIRHTQELDPNSTPGTLGRILYFKGDLAGALAQSLKRSYQEPKGFTSLAFIYARMGEKAKVEQILRELDEIAKRRYVSPSVRAYVYLALGEREKALDALEQAYVQQDLECSMLKVEPLFDPLRDEPRFQALMRQVGLEP
jgi:serine/threonine-protein kinase